MATDILSHSDLYHDSFYTSETFRGPSLHFHRRALGLSGPIDAHQRVELIYAVLTSWGMHRMGPGGSKMVPFDPFIDGITSLLPSISSLAAASYSRISETEWSTLETIFRGLRAMESKTSIVGNSKVMAHLLPHLVAPVDRQYTFKFLFRNTDVKNDIDMEWQLFRKIHEEFFYTIANDALFQNKAKTWIANQDRYPWDTSVLKVVDNLVIGALRSRV